MESVGSLLLEKNKGHYSRWSSQAGRGKKSKSKMLRRQKSWCRFFLENYGDIFGCSELLGRVSVSVEQADIVVCPR